MVAKATDKNRADLILVNGKVFTADVSQPYAEAVAIGGERILAIGASEEIAAMADVNTRRIDLQGHVAIPGINDAHYHFSMDPPGAHHLASQSMDPSWQETQDALAEAVREAPGRTWILGTIGGLVAGQPGADRSALDCIAPDHPVLLQSLGPWAIINTPAMHALGIGDTEPDPLGGYCERLPSSRRVNGKIFGYAFLGPYLRLVKRIPAPEIIGHMQALSEEAVRFGVTSIQDMPFVAPDRYVDLVREAQMPIRMRLIHFSLNTASGRDLTEGRDLPLHPAGQPLLTVRGTKWILDGTPFEWGSALRGAYLDRPDRSGKPYFAEGEIAAMVRESLQLEDQLLVHCSGDKPVEVVFDAMEQVPDMNWAEKRVRIEHGDGVVGDLVPRARRLGAIVVVNPTHFSLSGLVAQRYGPGMPFFPLRSLLEAGIPLAIGSDGPLNPYLNIMFAVLHPIHPEEAITREQAVEAYTRGSAFAEFEEGDKGTLARGKLADIAVLSQDIFTVPLDALPGTQSILTLVGGKTVYDTEALS